MEIKDKQHPNETSLYEEKSDDEKITEEGEK